MTSENQDFHERLTRREDMKVGSDRSFGLVMAGAFAVLSIISWWHAHTSWHWMAPAAGVFGALALIYPAALNPLNRLWMRFGLLLHAVVNPIIMAVLFFGAVTPTALVMRMRNKDMLRLRREPGAGSYWIERIPPGPAPESLKDQF